MKRALLVRQDTAVTDSLRGLLAVFFIDDQTGWAVGAGAVNTRTTDGGATWTEWVGRAGLGWATDVHFADANNGWITTTGRNSVTAFRIRSGGFSNGMR